MRDHLGVEAGHDARRRRWPAFCAARTQRFPCAALVLALEGHGAGYLPEIDGASITPAKHHAATATSSGQITAQRDGAR